MRLEGRTDEVGRTPSQRAGSGNQRALDSHLCDPLLVNGARAHLIHGQTASASQTGSEGYGETAPRDRFRGLRKMQLAEPPKWGLWLLENAADTSLTKAVAKNPEKIGKNRSL